MLIVASFKYLPDSHGVAPKKHWKWIFFSDKKEIIDIIL